MKRIWYSFFLILILIVSCKKDEDPKIIPPDDKDQNINHAPVVNINLKEYTDSLILTADASDPDNDSLYYAWTTNSSQIIISDTNLKSIKINIPENASPVEITVELVVDDGDLNTVAEKVIILPANPNVQDWGLGEILTEEGANNVNYNWYLDQMNSGTYNSVNCGPASVTMAIKWVNENFDQTPEDARNTYRSQGGWWYTSDIINYLNLYSIRNTTIAIDNPQTLKNEIDNGNIVILCLDMYYIKSESNPELHVKRFYGVNSVGWGHFIVLKGYKIVDDKLWFEFYDPYSFGLTYSDTALKGKDRYYASEDIDDATNKWWDYAIIVSKGSVVQSFKIQGLKNIPDMPGR